jgi:kinesin light chain
MTQMTQEEIMANTKTVVQGLEALKNEHNSILNGLTSSLELTVSAVVQQTNVNSGGVTSGGVGDSSVVEEKKGLVQKSLDMIDLGLGEAQVGTVLPPRK